MPVVTNSATYLSDVSLMRIDMVMTLLGNFSERPVTPYTLGIDGSFVVIYFHGFAMAGRTVNCFSLMDVYKTSSARDYSCLLWLKSFLPSRLRLGNRACRCQDG
jgi:hypothetical protein